MPTRYLEMKAGKWRVTVAVPRHLHGVLGTRLKRSLRTDSLAIAEQLKWPVVAELKAKIAEHCDSPLSPLMREAAAIAQLRRHTHSRDLDDVDYAIVARAEQIAGKPIGSNVDGEAVFDPIREKAAVSFADVARGKAVPVDLHHPDFTKQVAPNLTRRTLADDARALRFLRTWCETTDTPFMLHTITRRAASQFMDALATVSGAPSPVTHQKYTTRLSRYWGWMAERDLVPANPWAGLRPATMRPTPYNEMERPFTDAEMRKLLGGPASPAMHDLMRIAALTGARLDTIVDLSVLDCADGVFTFKPQKKERMPRRVPIHSVLLEAVARRCVGKAPEEPLFPEWPPPSNPESQRERSFKASNAFTDYRRRVDVDEVLEGRRRSLVNFHSFRRWFITRAEQAGVPESTIAWTVGHKRPGMTLGRYSAGPDVEQLRGCVEAVRLPTPPKAGGSSSI